MRHVGVIFGLLLSLSVQAYSPLRHYATLGVQAGALHVEGTQLGGEAALEGGYAMQCSHFLATLAVQAGYQYTSCAMPDYTTHQPSIDDQNIPYILNSIYTNQQARFHTISVAMPVMIGGTIHRFYGLVGPVVGAQVYGIQKSQSTLTTTGDYDPMLDTFHDMPNHGFYTREADSQQTMNTAITLKAKVELGAHMPLRATSSERRKRIQNYLHVAVYATYPVIRPMPFTAETFSVGIKCSIWWNLPTTQPCHCVR